jgi:serine/threonine-protein kinase
MATVGQWVPEIGRYHLIAELARGGMGIIHLAVAHGPAGFNKLLVVKELKPELSQDSSFVAMFLDEARLAARMTHPNIVQTNEVGSEGGRHFMVMEFLDGRTLHRAVRAFADRGGFPLGAHLTVIAEALVGLHYAHDLRGFDGLPLDIVHRDVSPHNLFITFDGPVKMLDFGIAKTIDSSQDTRAGVLKGRVAYMAPEQACGQRVDRRADLYAAGVMIWEAAAQRRLWPRMGDVEILSHVLRMGPPRLSSVRPDAPRELDAICAKAMARAPDERYRTAAELHDALEKYLVTRSDVLPMREIGNLVGQAFFSERARMNAVIEDTLHRLRGARSSDPPTSATDVHVPWVPSDRELDAARENSGNLSTQLVLNPPSKRPAGVLAATDSMSSDVHGNRRGLWGSRRVAMAGTAAGVVAAIGVVAAVALRAGRQDERPRIAAATAEMRVPAVPAAPMPPAAPPAPDLVDVTIHTTPGTAHITIDGAGVKGNPFHARYPQDARPHTVTAAADGYEAKTTTVSFAQNVDVELSLERHVATPTYMVVSPPPRGGKRWGGPAPDSAQTPAAATAPELSPAGGHAPLRPIDSSNPYGN